MSRRRAGVAPVPRWADHETKLGFGRFQSPDLQRPAERGPLATDRGLCADNPARAVKKAPVRKVERFLSEAELARLAEALEVETEKSGNPYTPAAIRLLLLTGCRKSEIVNLRWDHVDFERECLRLPDSKSGAKVVYLNGPARALLRELSRLAARPRVIPAMRAESAAPAIDKVWSRVRKRAELSDVRLHDLRHSFAGVGAIGGLSLPVIGALLGHKHSGTTARDAHLSADPLRAANEAVGARIEAAMRRGRTPAQSAEVVSLETHRTWTSRCRAAKSRSIGPRSGVRTFGARLPSSTSCRLMTIFRIQTDGSCLKRCIVRVSHTQICS